MSFRTSSLSVLGVLFLSAGCAPIHQQGHPVGILYNGTTAPSTLNQVQAGGDKMTSSKSGKACATGILGLVAYGDASLDAAKKKGGIERVNSVEHDATVVFLGAYTQTCTVAHGK